MSDPRSYLKQSQIVKILKAPKKYKHRLLFSLIAHTGRRVSEVVRCLKPSDIDFEGNLINFTILKRKRPTKVLLPVKPKIVKQLKSYIKRQSIPANRPIFTISRQHADYIFKKAAKKVGIKRVGTGKYNKPHLHLLRHSFAIEAAKKLKNPADLVQLKDMLAHSRIDTTMFYLKFNPTEKRELLSRMWK